MSSITIERKPERKSYSFHHPGANNYMKFWKKDDRLQQSSPPRLRQAGWPVILKVGGEP